MTKEQKEEAEKMLQLEKDILKDYESKFARTKKDLEEMMSQKEQHQMQYEDILSREAETSMQKLKRKDTKEFGTNTFE